MQALIEAETSAGERRARIVASFNRGYRSFQLTYRTCTPAAEFAIRRYLRKGPRYPAKSPPDMQIEPTFCINLS